jgi:hypothetical protein
VGVLNIRNIVTVRKTKDAHAIFLDEYKDKYPEANRQDVTKNVILFTQILGRNGNNRQF